MASNIFGLDHMDTNLLAKSNGDNTLTTDASFFDKGDNNNIFAEPTEVQSQVDRIGDQAFDQGSKDISDTSGVEDIPDEKAPDTKGKINTGHLEMMKAGAQILNADFKFQQISSKARMNQMLASFQQGEIFQAGKSQALRAESEGFARGEQALLAAAAQGQETTGGIAQSGQRAEELFGILRASMIETNAIRKIMGLEQQKALQEHEVNLAKIERDASIATSALSGIAGGAMAFG